MDQLRTCDRFGFLPSTSNGHGVTEDRAVTEASQCKAGLCKMPRTSKASNMSFFAASRSHDTVWGAATVIDFASAEVGGG